MTVRVYQGLGSLAAVTALLAMSGCAAQPVAQPRLQLQTLRGVERVAAPADAPVPEAVTGIWSFADAFGAATRNDGNTVFSPLSVASAFAMLRAAAAGQTASQLDATFGFPDAPGAHTAYNTLTSGIVTTDEPPPVAPKTTGTYPASPSPPVVGIGNGLFVQQHRRLDTTFLRTLAEQYGAGAQEVDFTSPEATRVIDDWVREQTAGRIDRLFDQLPSDTTTVLANAVYLKADWTVPFEPSATRDEPFHRADGSTVSTPTMHLAKPEVLRYVRTPDWQAVRRPYAGDELAMWVMVPNEATTVPRFDAAAVAALARAERRTVDLVLPRWDIAADFTLLPVLEDLGLTSLDDLPGISPSASVREAVHRADITVDEFGTEAAAATGIAIAESAPPDDAITLRADRPFAFAIVHEPTGVPMFLGTVADPTA